MSRLPVIQHHHQCNGMVSIASACSKAHLRGAVLVPRCATVPKQHYSTYIWVNYTYKAHKKLQNYPRQLLHTLITV